MAAVKEKKEVKKKRENADVATPRKKNTSFKSDVKQTAALVKAGKKSAANAIRASKALGLSITFMEKGILYTEKPNGEKEVISITPMKKKNDKKALKLKKGMILHAKK